MFVGVYELENKIHNDIYFYDNFGENGWKLWYEDTFSPLCKNIEVLDFKIKGKTYRERQGSLQEIAIDWSNNFSQYSWSYGELAEISSWFYKNAKKYGLVREFRENAIC